MILLLALSLLPAPLTEPGIAQTLETTPISPPAKAVRLLERLRDQGGEQQASPRRQGGQGSRVSSARARTINRKGCVFRVRRKTWILARTCAPRGTIVVPNGVTLNGRNRALIVTGNIAKFDGAVVASGFGRANVRNLRIEGRAGLTGQCPNLSTGILFYYSSGTIANVRIRDIALGSGCTNSAGIFAIGEERVNILNSIVANGGETAIALEDTITSTIAGNTFLIATGQVAGFAIGAVIAGTNGIVIRNNDFRVGGDDEMTGISASGNLGLTIANNRFLNLDGPIAVVSNEAATSAVIRDNLLTGVSNNGVFVQAPNVQILRNSVQGIAAGGQAGLELLGPASGVANNNAIANFACGILNASDITLGQGAQANTFANNTQDVCL